MFEGFAHVWTAVTLASRLRDRPLALTLAGTKIVFFRRPDGTPTALVDRCPHRGAQLSLGKRTPDGCLQCPFHGWRFDGDGHNQHVPFNPDAKREQLHAIPIPVREIGDLLWVYTAPGSDAPHEPTVPETLTRTDLARTNLVVEWNAHWTRAMENMLDSPHLPFVHRTTIGRAGARAMTERSRMDITWEDTPYGGKTVATMDDAPNGAWLDFYKPNMMVLHIPIPEKTFCIHAIAVPMGPKAVRMIIVGARSFSRLSLLNPLFNRVNRIIAAQDQPIVESQDPTEVPEPAKERSVRTDRATLQFRKYYYDALRASTASPTEPPLEAHATPHGSATLDRA